RKVKRMSGIAGFFQEITPVLQAILLLAVLVGGTVGSIFVFKMTKRNGIVEIQNSTIMAMRQRIEALEEQNVDQQKKMDEQDRKLDQQEFELKVMREALENEGIYITVDGKKI